MNIKFKDYIFGERWLTKQERRVLQLTLALLLAGWAVKSYRRAHPPVLPGEPVQEAKQ